MIRFDPQIFNEIERDPAGIPQAFAVVILTSVLAGLGQSSLALIFLWTALAIVQWVGVSALIWAAGVVLVSGEVNYARLLRCTGFAYLWFALLIGSGLPWIGVVFAWAAIGLSLVSLILATRQVFEISTALAAGICVIALGLPVTLLFALA